MGQAREHPGHKAEAMKRIIEARENYDTRQDRRGKQVWIHQDRTTAAPKGAKGALPMLVLPAGT